MPELPREISSAWHTRLPPGEKEKIMNLSQAIDTAAAGVVDVFLKRYRTLIPALKAHGKTPQDFEAEIRKLVADQVEAVTGKRA